MGRFTARSNGSENDRLRAISYELQVFTSSELSDGDKKAIWTLFEQNMHDLYDSAAHPFCCLTLWRRYVSSSFGWNEAAKRQELFHTLSRFVVVRRDETKDNGEPAKREGPVKPIVAFTMFRFDREEGENVVYWWVQCCCAIDRGRLLRILLAMNCKSTER